MPASTSTTPSMSGSWRSADRFRFHKKLCKSLRQHRLHVRCAKWSRLCEYARLRSLCYADLTASSLSSYVYGCRINLSPVNLQMFPQQQLASMSQNVQLQDVPTNVQSDTAVQRMCPARSAIRCFQSRVHRKTTRDRSKDGFS